MRDIKFRAYGPNCKMMWDWEAIKRIANTVGWEHFDSGERILMQYTGLKDKNGVEIYEGDIVTGRYHNLCVDYSKFGEVKFGYTYDSDGYANEIILGWISSNGSSLADLEECAVIGNIYENPELLESP